MSAPLCVSGVCVCEHGRARCRSLLLVCFRETGCLWGGGAGFKTMEDNDFNFLCNIGLTVLSAPLKGNVIFT